MIEQLHLDLRYQFSFMRDLDATVQQETNEAQQEIGLFCEKARGTTSEEWSKQQIPILDVRLNSWIIFNTFGFLRIILF